MARFLDHLAARPRDRPHTRSSLQTATGVNYDIFRRYLDLLERKGLARTEPRPGGSDAIHLTPEGARVRAELLAWISLLIEPSAILPARDAQPRGEPTGHPAPP